VPQAVSATLTLTFKEMYGSALTRLLAARRQ